MSNAPKYRKKAVEYEQLKQFDRAVASYVRAIEENENANEDVDVALFNKVGDLTLRQGRVTEAVTYYERAVEHYVSNNLFDNAIALCNKILRNAPGRSNVYFTLGRICGRKGLRTDATRNFLEYATRMQQEGRVDEGMRALAEVADLMPELTEVRRLVEEHAARAGISLAPRRRNTPVHANTQPNAEAVRSFGLSKDLVFLEIDYDAVKAVRGKTPPPQRSVAGEPSTGLAAEAPATAASAASAAAEVVPINALATPAQSPTARLEDLMIFDPRAESTPIDNGADDTTIVDGASILKPYADPTAPIASLDDLEPTEFTGTPAYNQAIANAEPVTDLLARGVAPRSPDAAREEPLDVVAKVPTIPNFPAVLDADDVAPLEHVASGIAEELFVPTPAVVEEVAEPLESARVADAIDALETIAAVESMENAEPASVIELIETNEENAAELVETSDATAVELVETSDATTLLESDEMSGTTTPVETIETIASTEAVEAVELVESVADVEPIEIIQSENIIEPIETVESIVIDEAVTAENDDIVNFAVEQELNLSLPAEPLMGFTADEEPLVGDDLIGADVAEVAASEGVSNSSNTVDPDVLPSLDFDAMLELVHPDVATVADLQTEEFTPANDELAATRFARAESESQPELVDEFESSGELPPLIFTTPVEQASLDVEIAPEIIDNDLLAGDVITADTDHEIFVDTFVESVDTSALENFPDIIDLDIPDASSFDIEEISDLVTPLAQHDDIDAFIDLDDVAVPSDASDANTTSDIVFLDIPDVDAPLLTPVELDVVTLIADDDLDDLFGDTDVPTAVVAAEATLVASSRCSELRAASNAEPENFGLRRRLAEALFEAGDREEAIAELGAALAGAESATALSDAADMADELVRVAGDELAHHQKRLEIAIRLGDPNRLRDAYLDLADNLVRRGEDLRAKAVYARVLEIDPWDDRARTALGDAAPPPPAKPPVAGSDDGHVSLADWLRDDEEPLSTRLRMREPDISGDEQDDFNALLKHFKEGVARSLGEDDYESHYDLGVAYKEMGLLDDAIGEFQMALRSRTNRLAAYEALGQCFIEQQSYNVAVTVLSRALHEPAIQDEQRVGVLYLLGISCEVLQRFDEARSYFQRVYATDIHFRDVNQRLTDLERTVR